MDCTGDYCVIKQSDDEEECVLETTKKYTTRPGPPRAANEPGCQGQVHLGNDGRKYLSKADKNGTFKWTLVKDDSVAKPAQRVVSKAAPAKKKKAKKAAISVVEEEEEQSGKEDEVADTFEEMVEVAAKPKKRKTAAKKTAGKKKATAGKAKAADKAAAAKDGEKVAGKRKPRAKKEKSAVKRAKSAYIFFATDQQKTFDKSVPVTERGKAIGERWRAMSAAEKKPYEAMAVKDKARAERERAALSN